MLLDVPGWLDYVRDVYSIDPAGYPSLTYIGLNFTKDTLKNYKLYFSFFKRLSSEEISKLLPVADRGHFDALYAQWTPTKRYDMIHRGCTFALKIDGDGTLTHYYHLRLPTMPFGPPQRLEMTDEDLSNNYHGACEEFTGDHIGLKRYYYSQNRQTIAETLRAADFSEALGELETINTVEYIESDTRDKFAWFSRSPAMLQALVERRGPPRLTPGLVKLCNDCGFIPFGPGSARDGKDHSVYFVQDEGVQTAPGFILFDGVRAFIRRHLKITDL